MPTVKRLTPNDYDEALFVLNEAFSYANDGTLLGKRADFEKHLPIMWTREHDYMSRHFGVRENGRLVALLGVYPLPVNIAGHGLLFGTIGNVGTLHAHRGKGYMKLLMAAALEEADRLGLDAARLDGLRSRYNRHGFEHAGSLYGFTLTARNASEHPPRLDCRFIPIEPDDLSAISFARACQQKSGIYALRETPLDFYMTLRAWEYIPYLALSDRQPVGYLCASADGSAIAEYGVTDDLPPCDLLSSWLLNRGLPSLVFSAEPADVLTVRDALSRCERWNVSAASMFNVFHWDRVADALLDLRCRMSPLPDGAASLGIEGWGMLEMTVQNRRGSARRTASPAPLTLDRLAAARFLFGPLAPAAVGDVPADSPLNAWLPLPLSWNGQDRV